MRKLIYLLAVLGLAMTMSCGNSAKREQEIRDSLRADSIMKDSIIRAKIDSIRKDSMWRYRVTPDLALFELHGPVKSVSNSASNGYYVTFSESGEAQGIKIISQFYSIKRDSEGRIIKISHKSNVYGGCYQIDTYSYVYGKDGFPVKEKYDCLECGDGFSEPMNSTTTKIQYDENYNVVKRTAEGGGPEGVYWKTQSYTIIDVDEFGNWIKRKCKHQYSYAEEPDYNHSTTTIETRKITYYERENK